MSDLAGINPADMTQLFDVVIFDGVMSPGVVKLSGHKREQTLDVKESDGQKGATTTWKGTKCGKFTATFYLIKDDNGIDDFAAWDDFAQHLNSTIPPLSGKAPIAKDIFHPDLARNDFHSVILATMGELEHDGNGGATIAVELSEYYPPKAAKAGGASGSKTKSDPNDPITQKTDELNKLMSEASKP